MNLLCCHTNNNHIEHSICQTGAVVLRASGAGDIFKRPECLRQRPRHRSITNVYGSSLERSAEQKPALSNLVIAVQWGNAAERELERTVAQLDMEGPQDLHHDK